MHEGVEKRFWKWFLAYSETLFSWNGNDETILEAFLKELKNVHPDLTFEIGPPTKTKRELIISANGIKEAFPYVAKLVNAKPNLNKWKVIAFRPRKGLDLAIQLGGITLDTKSIFFSYVQESNHKIGLKMYVQDVAEIDERVQYSVFIILDGLLGEYDVETKIGTIDIEPLISKEQERLYPLSKLPKIVDAYFKKTVN